MTRRTLVSAAALVVAAALHIATSPPPTYVEFRGGVYEPGPAFLLHEGNPRQTFAIDLELTLPEDAHDIGFHSRLNVAAGADGGTGAWEGRLVDCATAELLSAEDDVQFHEIPDVFDDCSDGSPCLVSVCAVFDWDGTEEAAMTWTIDATLTALAEVESHTDERDVLIEMIVQPIDWTEEEGQ